MTTSNTGSKQDDIALKKEKLRQLLLKKQQLTQAKAEANTGVKNQGYQAIPTRDSLQGDSPQENAPLSFAQQRLWFLDELQHGSPEYNMPAVFRVNGELDVSVLNQVFNAIIERHEVLRTVYVAHEEDAQQRTGAVTQKVQAAGQFCVRELQLTDEPEMESKLSAIIEHEVGKAFDLSADLMLRVTYIKVANSTARSTVKPTNASNTSVLLFNMHHIASDGWSMNVLMQEFLSLYQALTAGKTLTAARQMLPQLPIQYADFAAWQRTPAYAKSLDAQVDYWRKQLSGASLLHQVPLDFPRGHEKSHLGANVSASLPAAVATGLNQCAKAHQLTPFMLLHACLAYVLTTQYRYQHQQDETNASEIIIGTPVANRKQVELAPLIGFFVNTLALRSHCDFTTLTDYLAHIRQVHLDAQSHQDVPFERLVEALNIPRSRAYTPLFQIMLTTQTRFSGKDQPMDDLLRLPHPEQGKADLQLTPMQPKTVTAKFDLNIDLQIGDSGVELLWNYDVSLFTAAHIEQLNQQLCVVMQQLSQLAATRTFDCPLAELSMLDDTQRNGLLYDLNQTQLPFPQTLCVHELVEQHAVSNPHAIALSCAHSGQTMTYQALNAKADQLAQYLYLHHLAECEQRDPLIGVCLSRGINAQQVSLPCVLLAIMKAGATYVPFDSKLGANVVQKRASSVDLALVITEESTQAWFAEHSALVLNLDDPSLSRAIAEHPETPIQATIGKALAMADSGCYALTTSGSTGEPKLIGMPHRPLVNLLAAMIDDCPVMAGQHSVIQFASIGFDMSFTDTFLALTQGGNLVLIADEDQFDVQRLAEKMQHFQTSLINLPFAMLQALATYSNQQQLRFTALKVVLSTAEQLLITPEIREFFSRHSNATLRNHYGPSETHVCTSLAFNDDPASWPATPSIGQPIANLQCYVLSPEGNVLPKGAIGELVVGGVGLASGYLGNATLTAEKFVRDPFSDEQNARMYKTGDLVRWVDNAEGEAELQYLGRADALVKIRGFRVEIGAIEAALNDLALIQESCVIYLPEPQLLYAYVVLDTQHMPTETTDISSEILHALSQELPDYMLPKAIAIVDSLPLNTNGKIDKKRLPAPDLASLSAVYEAPQTPLENTLVTLWAELLKREPTAISVHDNFFDLGGHSLLATRVAANLQQQLDVNVSVKDLFDYQTLRGLAEFITAQQALATSKVNAIQPITDEHCAPLSYQQQRLWLLDQLETSRAQYNMPAAFRLQGELNIAALRQAITAVVERHHVLRTVYRADAQGQGQPQRVAMYALPELLQVHTIRSADSTVNMDVLTANENAIMAQANAAANHVFDLANDVMLQAKLLCFSEHPQTFVLLLTLHHIASDGWSINVLMTEIAQLYQAFNTATAQVDTGMVLVPLAIQYSDYAYWQRAQLQGETLAELTDFWTNYLAGAPAVHNLPLDYQRPPVASHRGAVFTQTLTFAELANGNESALAALLTREKVTLFMALNAAMGAFLARYSNSDGMLLGSPIANREQPELEGLIGFFVNTLVLRTRIDDNPSFSQLLARSKAELLDVYAHQQMPFEQVIEALNVERSAAYNPLFQVMLVLQNNEQQTIALDGLNLSSVQQSWPVAKFDLNIVVNETDTGLQLLWEYATDLFSDASIQTLAESFVTFFGAAIVTPEQTVQQLPLVNEAMQQALLAQGAAQVRSDIDYSLIDRFERMVSLYPDKTAVSFAGAVHFSGAKPQSVIEAESQSVTEKESTWTYQALHRASDSVAAYLWQQGVRPEQPLGMMIGRSLAQTAAIIGALKTGVAYVPLVLDISQERFTHIVESAGIQQVLIDELTCDPAVLAELQSAFPALRFISVRDALASELTWHKPSAPTADSLAYIIYTSGTTGVPKGVMTTHANIIRMYTASEPIFACHADDVWSVFHSYTFDFSVWEFWGGLLYGGGIVMLDDMTCRSPQAFIDAMLQHKVTVLNQTPSAFMQVINQSLLMQQPKLWQQLRLIILDGEPLDFGSLQPWFTFCEQHQCGVSPQPHPTLIHTYGITETTIHATYREVTVDDAYSLSSNLCGRPFADLSLYIVDAQQQLLPNGVAGQIAIGGEGLAKGYLGNPQLTAARFPENPLLDENAKQALPESRLYLTGDVGRITVSGELEVLGRMDHQVKIRGFRVELGDVEAALKDLPFVSHAVANAVDAHTLGACVALMTADSHIDDEHVLQAVAQKLPSYMVPDRLLVLEAMPLTPNGKVDRRAVKTLLEQHQVQRSETLSLDTDTEQKLADIWANMLTQQAFDRHDNFFQVGGHSLLCVQVALQIQQCFGVPLPVTDVYRQPVLKQLAQRIDQQLSAPCASAPHDSAQYDTGQHKFLTLHGTANVQEKPTLLLIHAIGGDVFAYHQAVHELSDAYSVITVQQPQFGLLDTEFDFSITRIAERYMSEVQQFCQQRHLPLPSVLMGWSFGGIVAHKMAQLIDIQQTSVSEWEVKRVVMLDSPLRTHERLPQVIALLDAARTISDSALFAGLRGNAQFIQQLKQTYSLIDDSSEPAEALLSLYTANSVALLRHHFHKVTTQIDYWQAQQGESDLVLQASDLAVLGDNTQQHLVSATHFSMVESPVITQITAQVNALVDSTCGDRLEKPQRS